MVEIQKEKSQLNPNPTFVEGYNGELEPNVVEEQIVPEVVVEETKEPELNSVNEVSEIEKNSEKKFFGFEPSREVTDVNDGITSADAWSNMLSDKVA